MNAERLLRKDGLTMMPIKEVREVIGLTGRRYRANICIDRKGRECVSSPFGYNLIRKDGVHASKRQADWK